ncbi:MAG: 2-amino-4-hydroxy-6-hydroxymethyldihydropteridine diphosphokinase [Rhodospirillaceae bacterium]
MIYVGIGANLHHPEFGGPLDTCGAALNSLGKDNFHILGISRWYRSAPVPTSDQPDYVNAVVEIETMLNPQDLMQRLLDLEAQFGRERGEKNAARTLDLDLLDYNGMIIEKGGIVQLPHPRLHQRPFVLFPLSDIAPQWRHPVTEKAIATMIDELDGASSITVIADQKSAFGTVWPVRSPKIA